MNLEILNGIGGQILLGAVGFLITILAYLLGRKFGVTPEQVVTITKAIREVPGKSNKEVAKEAQRQIRKKLNPLKKSA